MVNPTSMAFAGTDVIWSDFRSTQTSCSMAQVLKRTSATGATVVLAKGASCYGISNIAVLGPTAYWVATDSNQPELQATPVNGGATTTIAISSMPIPQIVASGEAIYWLEHGLPGTSMSAIRSIPGGGGTVTTLVSGFDAGAGTFAIDSSSVYYTTSVGANAVDLVSRPLAGGAPMTLVSSISLPTKLIIAGGNVVWIDGGGEVRSVPVGGGSPITLAVVSATSIGPFDVVFDGVNVVWTEATNLTPQIGSVRAVLPTGGAVTTLYQSTDLPSMLAVDTSSRVNWIDSEPRIARLDAGNSLQTVAWGINPNSNAENFVVTGETLIIPDGHRLKGIPLAGGPPSILVVDPNYAIGSLATDGTWLVWNGLGTGTLTKAPVAGGAATELTLPDYARAGGGIQLAPNGVAYWVIKANPENACYPRNCVTSASIASFEVGSGGSVSGDVFAVDATGVYISSSNQIVRAPLTLEGAPSTFVSTMSASALALDGATLYGIELANSGTDCVSAGSIFKVPTAGGAITCVIEADDGAAVGNLAFDSTYVYFADSAHQDIRRTPK
jgi:hypothetical protein